MGETLQGRCLLSVFRKTWGSGTVGSCGSGIFFAWMVPGGRLRCSCLYPHLGAADHVTKGFCD